VSINKLELKWYGKENEIKVEPRILVEDSSLSYSVKKDNSTNKYHFDNILIHGDNLLALKALEQDFTNKIQCIYIDPPYNTGNAFEHYDDNLEHSIWLSLMKPRLEILRRLLSESGSIFVQIDYNEQAYLKVLMDELFGRKNFITMITCKVKAPSGIASGASAFFDVSEYILVYAKNKDQFSFYPTKIDSQIVGPKSPTVTGVYNQLFSRFEVNNFGAFHNFEDIEINELSYENFSVETISKKERTEKKYYESYEYIFRLAAISGGRDKKVLAHLNSLPDYDSNKIYSYKYVASQGKNKGKLITNYIYKNQNILFLKDFIRVDEDNKVIYKQDILTNIFYNDWWQGLTGEGGVTFKNGQKPEKLLHQIFSTVTRENDYILDSFLGSGTTAAVSHKMNRKWIGIEMGEHAYTHSKKRLDDVISGADQSGISKLVDWSGGGGYKFYELAPTLVKVDSFGQPIINPEYNAEMLAIAVSKHEGYIFEPHDSIYWKQSKNGEKSFLFVTTKHISNESLELILNSINDDEYLLIVCKSYDKGLNNFAKNINIKKIPQSLLKNCEYGVENYNLNIIDVSNFEYEDDSND
jgi:adenine-specific DNA-methyltransferase